MYCGLQFSSSLGALGDHFGIILGSFRVHLAPFLDSGAPFWDPRAHTWDLRSKRGAQVAPKGLRVSRGCALCIQMGSKMSTDFAYIAVVAIKLGEYVSTSFCAG